MKTKNILCSYSKVTPADYQPPGFKEGECDNLWFEGVAMHFKVGEVESPFHTLKVAVSAEKGRVEKLQKGNQVSPTKEIKKVGTERRLFKYWMISL